MTVPELTRTQKDRMTVAAMAALSARTEYYTAQIEGKSRDVCDRLLSELATFDSQFSRALHLRGLAVGDTVRITVDGKYKGCEADIVDIESFGRLTLLIEGQTVIPQATEVEMVNPAKADE